LDKAAALPIATSTPVTNLRQYINSDLGYNDLKFQLLCSKIATVNSFEVVISNGLSFYRLHITFLNQMSFGNSDRAVYSDLNPLDGGQSLYPMSTVFCTGPKIHHQYQWHNFKCVLNILIFLICIMNRMGHLKDLFIFSRVSFEEV